MVVQTRLTSGMWNNVAVGTNAATYTSTGLANGDVVTVVLTSDATPLCD